TELPGAAVVLGSMAYLLLAGEWTLNKLGSLFASGFRLDTRVLDNPHLALGLFAQFAFDAFLLVLPVFVLTLILALLASSATGGFNFAWKGAEPKLSKINPLNGLKRMFGLNALVELTKALLKFGLVAGALSLVISEQIENFLQIGVMSPEPAMAKAAELIGLTSLVVASSLILITLIDVPWQKHQFFERMKMTKQEVKDEMKDIEGRPEVKAQIRKRQREMAANRMMQKVKDADVVITNPEHFSVALAYDPNSDGAPIVVAMGVDHLAFRIREEAKNHGVTIFPAPPLARALYYTSEVDQPIHHDLYIAVAQVIAYVFNLNSTNPDGSLPTKPDPSVPESMQFDALGRKAATQ
ncbi:MAG: EscU/YscU/HrcU family type III secretion system export apparatus switch protein, partial [Burkholderiaceae bacterium]